MKNSAEFSNEQGQRIEDFPEEFLAERDENPVFTELPRHTSYRRSWASWWCSLVSATSP